jgi:sec-independent protein translocase protein TatC
VVVIIVGAALITPGGDMFSLVALAVPMYVLYEASIIFGWVRQRRRRRRAGTTGDGGVGSRTG